MAKKRVKPISLPDEITMVEVQKEIARVFAWSRSVADILNQLNIDIMALQAAKVGMIMELDTLHTQINAYTDTVNQLKREISQIKTGKLVKGLLIK